MSRKKKPENKNLTQNDTDLWKQMTGDVKRLPGRDYSKPVVEEASAKKKSVLEDVRETPLPPPKLGVRKPASGGGLDRRTDERLRKGQMKIEARLDLHGMNQGEAHTALRETLLRAYSRGKRCVLVITGKGTRSREDGGVLRKKVPSWLALEPLGGIVLKTHPAKPKDGGVGALYILLRRKRD